MSQDYTVTKSVTMPCPRCGTGRPIVVREGVGPHYAQACCTVCGRWLKWIPRATPIDPGLWEERAAIMEYDGGLSREDAEQAARECLEQSPAPGMTTAE